MEPPARTPSVCALVRGTADGLPSTTAALNWDGPLAEGLRSALATGADWIWVVDDSVDPRPGALEGLIDASRRTRGIPAAAVLCGVVLEPGGRVDPGRAAWYRRAPTELAMAAAACRVLPIRASAGPVLVHRAAVEFALPPPRAAFAAGTVLEWTALLLRDRAGYMTADSEYVLRRAADDPALAPRTAARLVAGSAFAGTDRLRVAFDLAERALRRARAPGS